MYIYSRNLWIYRAPLRDLLRGAQHIMAPCFRGANLVWKGVPWVLKIQQTEVYSTGLRESSPEFLFNYIQICIYLWALLTICAGDKSKGFMPLIVGRVMLQTSWNSKFADDTYLLVGSSSIETLNNEYENIKQWAEMNNMKIHPSKTKELIVTWARSRTARIPPSPSSIGQKGWRRSWF